MAIRGKVLLLGGAGFLGRGIMRQAAREKWACGFTVYSRDELKQHLCRDVYSDAKYMLGDIRDTDRLALVMAGHDVVIHAAAMKYVVESEQNIDECVGINVFGTQSVVKAAVAARPKSVLFVSTDKAVEPANTYGLTKAIGEKIAYEASWLVPTSKFVTCRYGNVIGSTGSVLPVFAQQLATVGRVLVTDPNMTRFWISVDEAVDIIELTLEQRSGTVTIPMPKAMSIGAIARAVAGDAVEIIGARPGEKQHEKLLTEAESMYCRADSLYNMDYNIYTPGGQQLRGGDTLFELNSRAAEKIDAEEFMALAADAATV